MSGARIGYSDGIFKVSVDFSAGYHNTLIRFFGAKFHPSKRVYEINRDEITKDNVIMLFRPGFQMSHSAREVLRDLLVQP